MARIIDNLSFWARATLLQRVVAVSLLLACVGGATVLVMWARKPDLALLYSGLAPQEAGKILEKVRDSGAAYEIKDGGSSIYVASDKVYSLRLSLASESLPGGDQAGYRILDDEKIGASPFTQRINHTRAIEGELAKTIDYIQGVASCRVHVVQPEGTLFADKGKDATATVMLRLKGGRSLTQANVAAIVHLVAGSVENLRPEKVVVVDGGGNLLSTTGDTELSRGAGTYLDYKSQVEQYMAHKAEEMLANVLGPNRASVRVSAVIDSASLTSTTETYDPEKKVATKEDTKSKSPTATSQPSGQKEDNTTTEYLVSKVSEQKTQLPGQVQSVTVAAFVDLRGPVAKEGETPKELLPLKDAEEIIRNALGLKTTDTIKVVNVPFHQEAALAAEVPTGGVGSKEFWLEVARRGSLGILVLGALAALKMVQSPKKKALAAAALAGSGEGQLALAGASEGNLLPGGAEVSPDLLRSRITRALQENPEEVKRLFMSWVENEGGA